MFKISLLLAETEIGRRDNDNNVEVYKVKNFRETSIYTLYIKVKIKKTEI